RSGGPVYGTLSVPLTLGNGTDSGSGVDPASGVVEREAGVATNGTCGSWGGTWSPVTLAGGADTSVQEGKCYHYRYKISDNVGNQSAASATSADATIDTTAPAAPALTLAESSSHTHQSGTTL